MKSEIRKCPIHGETEFHYYEKSGRKGLWKCLKCESELSILKKQRYKLKAIRYKGGCCSICGYNKNIAALEFHHTDPNTKDFGISTTHHAWDNVVKELDKCILVCSNCHRELHNPQLAPEILDKTIENYKSTLELKKINSKRKKFKFNLEELNLKYNELKNWLKVAEYYEISLATLKRHRKELEGGQDG